MQRVPQRVRKTYSVVRLYLDDVQELVELFQQHCDEVTIEAEGYKLQSFEGIREVASSKIRRLKIIGWKRRTFLQVDLRKYRAEILVSRDDDIPLKGVFAQVDAILTRRAPYLRFWASYRTADAIGALIILVSCTVTVVLGPSLMRVIRTLLSGQAAEIHFTSLSPGDLSAYLVAASYLAYVVWVSITRMQYRSVIYLQAWRERTTFWERNKEEMLRETIVGVVIAIITFILGYIAGAQH